MSKYEVMDERKNIQRMPVAKQDPSRVTTDHRVSSHHTIGLEENDAEMVDHFFFFFFAFFFGIWCTARTRMLLNLSVRVIDSHLSMHVMMRIRLSLILRW